MFFLNNPQLLANRTPAWIIAAFVSCLALADQVHAEDALRFHSVDSSSGHRHISMIPPEGYAADGRIKGEHNPNSIQYQHIKLIERISRENDELLRIAEQKKREQQSLQNATQQTAGNAESVSSSGPLGMNARSNVLEKLIELENRGGRATTADK